MAYIQGEARGQQALFPSTLDDLIPTDHVCRVIEAFVAKLDVAALGFVRAEPAETGRPGYDPRDLLKLYLYGYLQQVRSSRRLEAECRRNGEVMWLLGRLTPDYKSIAEFRRVHREAVTAAGAELVRMARQVGLVKGEWVAIDGSKFRAVSSAQAVREREAVKRYLDQLENADQQDEVIIDQRRSSRAGEAEEQSRAGSAIHADGTREYGSSLQRPDCGRCQARDHCCATGHNRSQRPTQSAADGRSGETIAGQSGNTQCGRRRWLLERRASGTVRGSRHRAARADQSGDQQPRRWDTVRPPVVRL